MTTSPPVLIQLEIDDPASAWEAAGFAVGDDGRCQVGAVTLRFGDGTRGGGIRAWSLTEVEAGVTTIDGLHLSPAGDPASPVTHPNTASRIDHLVIQTPDVDRTARALEAVGLAERRRRHTESYGSPMTQVFHRAGEVIIEVVGPPKASGDEPASFFGLAFTLDDLDAPVALLGDALGDRKPAVQEGRDRRGLRHEHLGISVPVLMMSAPAPG
jgi:hypothetical protein